MRWSLLPLVFTLALPAALTAPPVWGAIDGYRFDNPVNERRYRDLIEELRCPKCQNQNIADSNAPLSTDLRQRTYEMIQDGASDKEIVDFMVARYGDFVTYRPPMRPLTWPLWFGPFAIILAVGIAIFLWVRRRRPDTGTADPSHLSDAERERLAALMGRYADGEPDKDRD